MNTIITLDIDDEVLAKAERIAAKKHTTVGAMVREYLTRIAKSDKVRAARTRQEFVKLAEKSTAEVGPITWTRDDLHER